MMPSPPLAQFVSHSGDEGDEQLASKQFATGLCQLSVLQRLEHRNSSPA